MPGTLFVISTPIGNLEDITLRALRVLKEIDFIACESPRQTLKLLTHYQTHLPAPYGGKQLKKPLIKYTEHQWYFHPNKNKTKQIEFLISELEKGKKIGLITNAGTPVVSDPGYNLVKACLEKNIPVVSIPGPSALTSALSVCGFPADRFVFEGFLPRKMSTRHQRLAELKRDPRTIVLYEAPHRLLKTLKELYQFLGNRPIAIARELTKYYEEVKRGSILDMINYYMHHPIKGEFTLVISGKPNSQNK